MSSPPFEGALEIPRSHVEGPEAPPFAGPWYFQDTEHLRLARRLLATTVERLDPPRDALVIGDRGAWFCVSRGERVSLERRQPLQRLIWRLACERILAPGSLRSASELAGKVWDGAPTRMVGNRLRVAVSTLRTMGLSNHLETVGDGYRLSPAVPTYLAL